MSKAYEEEKRMYLDAFNVSGKTKTAFARENNIPETTFRAWIKEDEYLTFGAIQLNNNSQANIRNIKIICKCKKFPKKLLQNKKIYSKIVIQKTYYYFLLSKVLNQIF